MVDIPFVDREEMIDRAFRIKAVRYYKGKPGLHYIYPIDIKRKPITDLHEEDIVEDAKNLTEIARIKTFHCAGPHNYFRPRTCEVLAQIPEKYLDTTTVFHVIEGIDAMADGGNYFIATTVLYKGELPDRVKHQRVNYIGESITFAKHEFDKHEGDRRTKESKEWREGVHQRNIGKVKKRPIKLLKRKPF